LCNIEPCWPGSVPFASSPAMTCLPASICSLRRELRLLAVLDLCPAHLGRDRIYLKEEASKLPGGL
jgi:hypothetical protein